jgi:hypothetical protein
MAKSNYSGGVVEHISFFEWVGIGGENRSVDSEHNTIRRVKILGKHSTNGRVYTQEAIRKAVEMYEGARVNVNHPAGGATQPRAYQDRFGVVKNVTAHEDGLYGDLIYNPKHAVAEQFVWDAEHQPQNVGLSHNVQASVIRRQGKTVVEQITKVQSVDVVADPATTKGLFENESPVKEGYTMAEALAEATVDDVRRERKDIVEVIETEALAKAKAGQVEDETKAENDRLREENTKAENDRLREENRQLKADAAKTAKEQAIAEELRLRAAELPESAITEVFQEQLSMAADKAARARLIEDRIFAGSAGQDSLPGGARPLSREQNVKESAAPMPATAEEFAARIKP